MNKTARRIATLFGIGDTPYAPGTVASVVSLPFAWLLAYYGGRFTLLFLAILALAIGAWASEIYASQSGKIDPRECVVDELAGQWIACAFAPVSPLGYLLAFALFRLFDIWKPWPIGYAERLHGGLGIMLDDVAAALMGGAILVVLSHVGLI